MKKITPLTAKIIRKPLVLFVALLVSISGIAQSGAGGSSGSSGKGKGPKLDFKNPVLVNGTPGKDGATYKFEKIGEKLDAKVKITGRSSSEVYLVNMDLKTSGYDKAWQPQVGFNNNKTNGAGEWWMEFDISFIEEGTSSPATIEEFNLTAIDIDGNGDKIREYVSFYNLQSYTVEQNSVLQMTSISGLSNGVTRVIGKRFDGPIKNLVNIDTSGTSVMVTATYKTAKSFTVRVGAVASGASSATERMYSLYYESFKYSQPVNATLPVKLHSFTTKLVDNNVQINWTTAEEINFSHFVVERGTNGTEFKEIGLVFSEVDFARNGYAFIDQAIDVKNSGLMYYRLRMVDRDGSYKYSNVKVIKMNSEALVSVIAYPNPVTNQLRITIPASWQNKTVKYEMVNMNGVVVKQQVNQHASQTETIEVRNLQSGNYIIRLHSGNEVATHMIAKN